MNSKPRAAWESLPFGDVSKESLERGLSEHGISWQESLHVAATGSLAKAMRLHGWPAISVKELTDFVIWSGMPTPFTVARDFPPLSGDGLAFKRSIKEWRREVRSRSIELHEEASAALRAFLDTHLDRPTARVLRGSVTDLLLSIRSLASAGIEPSQLCLHNASPLVQTAVKAWSHLEDKLPHLFRPRDDLWTPDASTLRRVEQVLADFSRDTRPTLVYHGFYFFTPPQWAWFALVKKHIDADQYFIIHDDGKSRVFEVWRRFFDGRWGMPHQPPVPVGPPRDIDHPLLRALEGGRVEVNNAHPRPELRLTQFSNVSEFAAEALHERQRATKEAYPYNLYAADAAEIDRVAHRFGLGPSGPADLANTVLGQFFTALHSCVNVSLDGEVSLTLRGELLIDMAASGLLDADDPATRPSQHLAAMQRALPFFDGLADLDAWVTRAEALRHLVTSVSSAYGTRTAAMSDRDRIETAVNNPLRLAPWCDISDEDAVAIHSGIKRIRELVAKLSPSHATSASDYMSVMRRELSRALKLLSRAERDTIALGLRQEALMRGRGMDMEGIIGTVAMHLRRGLDDGLTDRSDEEDTIVGELRTLDALAFAPSAGVVHITNLVDTAFPSRVATIGWPFDRRLLDESPSLRPQSRDISRAREEIAGLADLYLFWLALHGVQDRGQVHLSAISEFQSARRNASPLLMLLAELDAGRDSNHVVELAGGFELTEGQNRMRDALSQAITPPPWPGGRADSKIDAAIGHLDPISTAAVQACPRRFALQWVLGTSHAFPAPFQHRMLFGNVHSVLWRDRRFELSGPEALAVVRDVWRHLTSGERLSSLRKRVVLPVAKKSAKLAWIFTLGGAQSRTDRISNAYNAAWKRTRPTAAEVAPLTDADRILPSASHMPPSRQEPNPDFELCKMCPSRPTCSEATLTKEW